MATSTEQSVSVGANATSEPEKASVPNPIVFFDMTLASEPLGRIKMELFADNVPKTAENFRQFCTGETRNSIGKPRGYKGCRFHRVVCLRLFSSFSTLCFGTFGYLACKFQAMTLTPTDQRIHASRRRLYQRQWHGLGVHLRTRQFIRRRRSYNTPRDSWALINGCMA